MNPPTTTILFGSSRLRARETYQEIRREHDEDEDERVVSIDGRRSPSMRPTPGSVQDFFFGFMYEEDLGADDELYYKSTVESTTLLWNPLHAALCLSLTLQTVATATAVTLVSSIGHDDSLVIPDTSNHNATLFAQRAASAAVLGTAIGKFCNGPVADVCGARRTSVAYALALCAAFIILGLSPSQTTAVYAAFWVEFLYSVQWPCTVVVLATHYRGNTTGMYEGGIFVTSLASRLGSLIGIPVSSWLIRRGVHWRLTACLAAWLAAVASSVTYHFVRDSVHAKDEAQNPIDPSLLQAWLPDHSQQRRQRWTAGKALRMAAFVVHTNILPSVKHIFGSGTFWIVAVSHTGASMVRTSERILGTYFFATSNGSLTYERAASLAVWHSVGTFAGLLIAGKAFASKHERARKWMVSRLYVVSIVACYVLALTAVPAARNLLPLPDVVVTVVQVMAVVAAGFGIAVQFYHIPSLVGATFGCDKGLFSAYTDGVAYGLASLVWRFVGQAMQGHAINYGENNLGIGWAYGWAAVALLLILSAILMVEFMEHYFCRPRQGGTYETIIFA